MTTVQPLHPAHAAARSVEDTLALAFAPLHKRAFGVAIGAAVAVVVMALTVVHVLLQPERAFPLGLLHYYFYGYDVSWRGALLGGFWGFVSGFVAGWFVAFCRNFVVAVSVFLTRARAELNQTRDFLDHI